MEEETGTVKAYGLSRLVFKILGKSVDISKDKEDTVM